MRIPIPLFRKVEQRIGEIGFTSVSSYIAYVLRKTLSDMQPADEPFTHEDKDRILSRLKSLGYLS